MPRLIIFLLFLCSGFYLSAQDCTAYMPMEEGSVREMKTYDERDKLTGSTIQTVKEVKGSAEKMDIIVHFQHFDKKGEEVRLRKWRLRLMQQTWKYPLTWNPE